MSGLSPLYKTLGDVNLTGLANGDLATYNSTTGKWEPITRSALATALGGLSFKTGSAQTGTLAAGASVELQFTLIAASRVIFISALDAGATPFYLWEASYITSNNFTGRFSGPGITTITDLTPSGAPSGANFVRIVFKNRDAVDKNLAVTVTAL